MANSDVYAMIDYILLMPFGLGMLVAFLFSLLLVKLTNILFPVVLVSRREAVIMSGLVSGLGPIGVLVVSVLICLLLLLKLVLLLVSKTNSDSWDKPL